MECNIRAKCDLGAPFEVALFFALLVLVLNEMVLVLLLDAVSSSTSTASAEYEYEKPWKIAN